MQKVRTEEKVVRIKAQINDRHMWGARKREDIELIEKSMCAKEASTERGQTRQDLESQAEELRFDEVVNRKLLQVLEWGKLEGSFCSVLNLLKTD